LSLLSIRDLSERDLEAILERGTVHAVATGPSPPTLEGRVVGIYFTKTSTRTRTAFSAAALRLGGSLITFGPDDLQIATGETLEDTGRVLARMLDALVVRTAGDPEEMRALAQPHEMPVVNAMSADEHPTQALCDLTLLRTRFSALEGLRVLYLGEGNNTAAALCLALARQQRVEVDFRTPAGYGLAPAILASAERTAARTGARLRERHDLDDLASDFDVVYTTRWQTTGTSKEDPGWRAKFEPFRVTAELMAAFPNAIFMHDLPAHRGEEVEAEVIDGPASVVLDQAACKMYSAMAALEWVTGRLPTRTAG
jgi:ornithine carbamoyltransferase